MTLLDLAAMNVEPFLAEISVRTSLVIKA